MGETNLTIPSYHIQLCYTGNAITIQNNWKMTSLEDLGFVRAMKDLYYK